MHFTSEQHLDGIVERHFTLDGINGILWSPLTTTAAAPSPLVLAGQPGGPGGLEQTRPRLLPRARQAALAGFTTATIEFPGSGTRRAPDGVAEARAELREAVTAGRPVPDDVTDRLVLPIVEQADLVALIRDFPGKTLATTMHGASLYEQDLTGSVAFVIGNEGAGLSQAVIDLASEQITIPMPGKVESLNAAAAAAVCLFERVRQAQAV